MERTFWRDVATRTIAGVLTILILAVPGLIYAGIYGLLTPAQVAPILIGITMFAALIVGYLFSLWVIRWTTRRKIKKTLGREKLVAETTPSLWEFFESSPEERDRILSGYGESTRNRITRQERFGRRLSNLATVTAAIAGFVSVFIPWLWK